MFELATWHTSFPDFFIILQRYTVIEKQLLFSNDINRFRCVEETETYRMLPLLTHLFSYWSISLTDLIGEGRAQIYILMEAARGMQHRLTRHKLLQLRAAVNCKLLGCSICTHHTTFVAAHVSTLVRLCRLSGARGPSAPEL
jgi:hypothetical protein